MTAESILFALIRFAMFGEPVSKKVVDACTPEMLEQVYKMAKLHDAAHLAGYALDKLDVPDCEYLHKCRNKMLQAIYRHAQQEYEYQSICAVLDEAKIAYLPLKGVILRPYYPEAWMRTCCDIDILVHKEDLESAAALLVDKLRFVQRRMSAHDLSLITPTRGLFELHYAIIEDFISEKAREVLDRIWEYATPAEGETYRHVLPDDLFYYYHMVHMAKHVAHGGCSIRFFLDTWILNHKMPYDRQKREALLENGGRLPFAQAAEKLAEIWFSDEKEDTLSRYFANYILRGGNFGSLSNRVAFNQAKEGGKVRFMMQRIILPYNLIKYYYPILQEHKWLTPAYQVVRWWRLLTRGDVKHSIDEVRVNARYNPQDIPADVLIRHLGLTKE